MLKLGLIPPGSAVNSPRRLVAIGNCGTGSEKNMVDFVLSIFPAANILELYI